MGEQKMLRIAVVGTGLMGRIYAQLLSERSDVKLCGIVGRSPGKTKAVAKEFRVDGFAHGQVKELFSTHTNLDGVVLATPEWVRLNPLRIILHQGIRVLVE